MIGSTSRSYFYALYTEQLKEHLNKPETIEFIKRNAEKRGISKDEMLNIYIEKLYQKWRKELKSIFQSWTCKSSSFLDEEPVDHTIHIIPRQNQKYLSAETHRAKLVYCGGGLYRNDINLEEAMNE